MRASLAAVSAALLLGSISPAARLDALSQVRAAPPTANCVTIGTPKPSVGYTYEHVESTGNSSRYTQFWESVTPTGSRVRIVKPGETLIQSSVYRVVDDVAVIGRMTKAIGRSAVISTSFRPGLVSDPVFRACAGRAWPVPSVTASYAGAQSASAPTPAGRLTIVSISEKITVPAGTFDTVNYVRTSESRDVYWKSTLHGVIVKHMATLPTGGLVTETLVSIK